MEPSNQTISYYAVPNSIGVNGWAMTGTASSSDGWVSTSLNVKNDKKGYHPLLAFKYIKSKFGMLERSVIDRRLKKLEAGYYAAVENGQDALGEKILREVSRETKETQLYAKGFRHFVERDDICRVKNNIKGGHISDTQFRDYTRVIPREVLAKKKQVEGIVDGFVIYHYYNEELEKKVEKKQKMSAEEKSRMRDPILFAWIKECDRLYFIADWEDEHCDLTFEEIVDAIGDGGKITKYPNLKI